MIDELLEHGDVIAHLHTELEQARAIAAAAIDRAEALVELRRLAVAVAGRSEAHFLTIVDLFDAPRDEQERARMRALVDRAFPTHNPERTP